MSQSIKIRQFVEAVVFAALIFIVPKAAEALAELAGFSLPQMGLLKRTYLSFAVVLGVLAYVRLRGESFASFGLPRPEKPLKLIGRGLLIFVAVMAWNILGRPVVDQLVVQLTGASTTMADQYFAALKGNLPLTLYVIGFAWIFAAFGEEVFYRGVIMTRIAQVLGEGRIAWIAAMFLQAVPFALGHAYQGPVGMAATYGVGVLMGAGTLVWGRNIWPAVIAHGVVDSVGLLLLCAGAAHA